MRLFKIVTMKQTANVYFVRAETIGDAVDEVKRNTSSTVDQFEPVESKNMGEMVIDQCEEPLIQYYNYMYKNKKPLKETHIRNITPVPKTPEEEIYSLNKEK